jgi:hypothetical protein
MTHSDKPMLRKITTNAPIALAVFLAATVGATEVGAASAAKKHKTVAAMHAQHHGMKLNHKKHMAMMRKMHVVHHGEMEKTTMRMAMMPAKQAGSCGTYMYWKAGACLDARNKK